MGALSSSLGFLDIVRAAKPDPERLFSWWSYRAVDFRLSNRGLRLDHILLTPGLRPAAIREGEIRAHIHDDVRAWERPSDHAPITADLAV
jgi:exodeoxyribonuclease-3